MPIEYNGTPVGEASVDGQPIDEVTVNGQTVFSAGPNLPVAYSNLVAWYPFDAATYGGSNDDDVTAIIAGSGDGTAYDAISNSATYDSSAGLTDINAGENSGAFDFNSDFIQTDDLLLTDFTITAWASPNNTNFMQLYSRDSGQVTPGDTRIVLTNNDIKFVQQGSGRTVFNIIQTQQYQHIAVTGGENSSGQKIYINGVLEGGTSLSLGMNNSSGSNNIGSRGNGIDTFDGQIDDVRIYNTPLSSSQIEQIVENTQDPSNPVFP